MNKYSLDRGFGRCIVLRKYGATMKKYMNRTKDRVLAPELKPGEVRLCCSQGVVPRGGHLHPLLDTGALAAPPPDKMLQRQLKPVEAAAEGSS